MSIKPDYLKYLEHFGKTVPICQLHQQPKTTNLVALRHDVDYDLDLALEMAFWEHDKGCRSTYYLLHSADYWQDPRFIEKCLQLQDFGHEVGLHLNVLAEWMSGNISEIKNRILSLLSPLRTGGVTITGVSSHGDKSCYINQFINYWCFSELRPVNPLETENGLSAEGIAVDNPKFQIRYPATNRLRRPDGRYFDLWSISMKPLGLCYDAMHVGFDSYFTDSGGNWNRSNNPLEYDLSKGRHQILMHPIYWKGSQKFYFFLSTARSGSKWLVNMLDKATPLTARHEFTLNHTYHDGQLVMNKRTSHDLVDLIEDRNQAKELIFQIRDCIENCGSDYSEANVYLEQFIPELLDVFPQACLIHLFRNPSDVVRSIMNRNWYDTPEDTAHPQLEIENFSMLPQFTKACWYVRKTNENLLAFCNDRLKFEDMVDRPEYLSSFLHNLGIAYFPRLGKKYFPEKINTNTIDAFDCYEQWSDDHKQEFAHILGDVNAALGYGNGVSGDTPSISRMKFQILRPSSVIDLAVSLESAYITSKACTLTMMKGLRIVPIESHHAHVLLGGGTWYQIDANSGWPAKSGYYFRGSIAVDTSRENGRGSLLCLMYNQKGELIHKRTIGIISQSQIEMNFSFRLLPETRRFNIAIYIPTGTFQNGITINNIRLQAVLLQ